MKPLMQPEIYDKQSYFVISSKEEEDQNDLLC